jgi:asparagine synthase (glutamine-hydrolysing)
MCGIAGVVYDEPHDRQALRRTLLDMCRAQRQRGPDGLEIWTDARSRVGLAMVRLAVVGSAERGRQPIQDHHGSQLVFNGELYRPSEVMASLGGTFDAEECDGTALLRLLQARGVDGLRGVSAMFSLAMYDARSDDVLLARDAWGQKPLYLRRTRDGYVFASTIAALRRATGPLRIRRAAVYECLVFKSVGGNHSAFEDVRQLPAGGWMRIERGGAVQQGHWLEIPDPAAAADRSREVRQTLSDAIAAQCPDRHRAAIFLSGGLDSSIVAAVASRAETPSPHVFTVGYDVGGWEDEHDLAVKLADELGLAHQSVIVTADQVPDLMRDSAVALEDPVHDPVTVPTLALSRAAAVETKVVLTGDGSDEFWGGYARFDDPTDDLDAYLRRTMVFEPAELGLSRIPQGYLGEVSVPPAGSMSALDRILRLETANRLRNYHLSRLDKLSMAASLEARSPFLDLAVTSLAMSLPAASKRAGGRPKGMLIDAFASDLPSWLLMRKKQPFTVPVKSWLAGALRDFCRDTISAPDAFVKDLVDPRRWLDGFTRDSADAGNAMRLWSLLHLEVWYRAFGRPMEAAG